MPAVQSEETMHLFIDFLAEGRICQTVCAWVSVRVRQSTFILCDRDTLGGRKRRVTQAWREMRSAGEPDKRYIHGNRRIHCLSQCCLWCIEGLTWKKMKKRKKLQKIWVNCQNNSEEYWRYDTGYLSFVYVIEDLEALASWRHKGQQTLSDYGQQSPLHFGPTLWDNCGGSSKSGSSSKHFLW